MNLDTQLREMAREEARAEIASLCGLVLRRLQDLDNAAKPTPERPLGALMAKDINHAWVLRSVFGEALRDFSGTETEPGE